MDRDEIKNEEKPPSQKLAILYTSRQINREAFRPVYANIDLKFCIDPYYDRKSWLRIETNLGTKHIIQGLDDPVKRKFCNLPYAYLRGVHIDIQAPNRRDPGQVVCLFKKCTNLVTLLLSEHTRWYIPDLTLQLSDSAEAKWTVDGEPQMSVAYDRPRSVPPAVDPIIDRPNDEAYIYCDDSQIVMCAFLRIRNAKSGQIIIPPDMERQTVFLHNLADLWSDDGPFGGFTDPAHSWNDIKLQERLDMIFTELDLELDVLPGATADMLRLERCAEWYVDEAGGSSPYEKEYERITKAWTHRERYRDKNLERLNWRYGIMRALNPRSLYYQYTKPRVSISGSGLLLSMPENDPAKKEELLGSGLVSKVWDRDAWYQEYANGIPPCRLEDNWGLLQLFSKFHADVLPKRDYDMSERSNGWVALVPGTETKSQKNVPDAEAEQFTKAPKSNSSDSEDGESSDSESSESSESSSHSWLNDPAESESGAVRVCRCQCKCKPRRHSYGV